MCPSSEQDAVGLTLGPLLAWLASNLQQSNAFNDQVRCNLSVINDIIGRFHSSVAAGLVAVCRNSVVYQMYVPQNLGSGNLLECFC